MDSGAARGRYKAVERTSIPAETHHTRQLTNNADNRFKRCRPDPAVGRDVTEDKDKN